jgi:hypothetical protein
MTKERLRLIRGHLVGLKAVFHEPASGPGADDCMGTVRGLCRAVFEALEDNPCREHLDLIELYARDLFSHDQAKRPHGPQCKADSSKQRINECLATIEARVLLLPTTIEEPGAFP